MGALQCREECGHGKNVWRALEKGKAGLHHPAGSKERTSLGPCQGLLGSTTTDNQDLENC